MSSMRGKCSDSEIGFYLKNCRSKTGVKTPQDHEYMPNMEFFQGKNPKDEQLLTVPKCKIQITAGYASDAENIKTCEKMKYLP